MFSSTNPKKNYYAKRRNRPYALSLENYRGQATRPSRVEATKLRDSK